MIHIIIMRHAKSSWDFSGLSDHQRPLNERGQMDTPRMAKELEVRGIIPELILSSDSKRTRETYDLLGPRLHSVPVIFTAELYHANATQMLQLIKKQSNVKTIMLLAHNPGVTDLVYSLCRINPDNIPTAGIACVSFNCERLSEIEKGNGELEYYIFPKQF